MRRILVAALLLLAACAPSRAAPVDGAATVVSVTDGDTIDVDFGGAVEPVRMLGIDTPETHHPTKPVECFGAEASARTAELLPEGTEVHLVRDVEARDRYGRLLAYVYRAEDDLFVNRSLAEDGYADVLDIAPNGAHAAELAQAVSTARVEGRGLWGACGGPDVPVR
ncbi:MAG: thermonuclease family protein [Acidimicrobiales bacterium]|nr:thermonuclease family protein [Acidimicrobiales bacterium]